MGSSESLFPISNRTSFSCGLLAGILQAGLFNPIDRALYLSVKEKRPFLSRANFETPYRGFLQSISGRALSSGLFYPLEYFFLSRLPADAGPWANLLAGTGSGMINALLLNPLTAIKYKIWGRKGPQTMLKESQNMYNKGGIRPFWNGLQPTLYRDIAFGGTYTALRLEIKYWFQLTPDQQWMGNLVAAAIATIFSGPFNLARNTQYATKSEELRPSTLKILKELISQTIGKPNLIDGLIHFQNRLRIGWGTARVAIGMTFGQYMYERLMWTAMASRNNISVAESEVTKEAELRILEHPTRRPTLFQNHENPLNPSKKNV